MHCVIISCQDRPTKPLRFRLCRHQSSAWCRRRRHIPSDGVTHPKSAAQSTNLRVCIFSWGIHVSLSPSLVPYDVCFAPNAYTSRVTNIFAVIMKHLSLQNYNTLIFSISLGCVEEKSIWIHRAHTHTHTLPSHLVRTRTYLGIEYDSPFYQITTIVTHVVPFI